ncbi:beta strand repeat-containing protein [Ethanoligenens harbinense]|uniref:Ig-like domain-containing protein n=1 Tax=Ethanoligenens harbinense (strain DSM 18485 / JCM 12961 / CGMCC 1.5033 / YUAN-3) TaxID=663278 RepID=E6U555_ETHHY|nr:hypothetical protein [Ethanoligenens harbinense]ADU27868.1 Domain of unknown function DUF1869 [Ethanoligenens harbinense YUAN-3]
MKKKFLSIFLALCMMLTMLPGGSFRANAASVATVGGFTVTGGLEYLDYDYSDNTLTILSGTALTISGTTATETDNIYIDSSVATANITLDDVKIDATSQDYSALEIDSGTTLNLTLKGDNVLTSRDSCAGVEVQNGATLNITDASTGTLTATGGAAAAGIGGDGYCPDCGSVAILGGNVHAVAGSGAEAIGHGSGGADVGTLTGVGGAALSRAPTVVTLSGVTDADVSVNSLTFSGNSYAYPDMTTLNGGALYLWLPTGVSVTGAAAGGSLYSGSVASGTTGTLSLPAASVTTSGGVTTGYPDFASALTAAQGSGGSTLTLLSDAACTSEIGITKKMTLDLNGYKLDMGVHDIRVDYYSVNYGELTITDSSAAKSGILTSSTDTVCSLGRVTVNGGTIQTTGTGCYALWCETSYANVVINGGTFIGTRDDIAFTAGALTINGGNFTTTGLQADAAGVTLKGGTFSHIQAPSGATANSLLADGYQYYVGSTASGTAADGSGRIIGQTVTVGGRDWANDITYDSASKTYTVLSANGLRWISGVSNGTITADTYPSDPVLPGNTYFTSYTIKLGADIDLSGKNWTPIQSFMGTFDGAGHKITGMTVDVSDNHTVVFGGFFDYLYGTAENLSVSGSVTVTGGSSSTVYAGGITGDNKNSLSNCKANVNVTAVVASGMTGYAGGLAGVEMCGNTFNCISLGSITASGDGTAVTGALVGGIVSGALTNCYASASVNPTLSAVGYNDGATLTSIGAFDASGALTADSASSALAYGNNLANAVKYWVNQQQANAVNYVTWTTDTVPTLTTTYAAAYTPTYSGDWQKQPDGSYTRTDPDSGLTETAEAAVENGGTETPCETLEGAITAAQSESGCTVKLLTDATTENTVEVSSGTFTIDLNGKTWTSTAGTNNYGFRLDGTSNVTLKDSAGGGTFTGDAGVDYSTIYAKNTAVRIESGFYNCTGDGCALYADAVNNPNKKVTITGGTFLNRHIRANNPPVCINASNASISGGVFSNDYGQGVFFYYCPDVSFTGGTFADVEMYADSGITTVGGLLADGYAYRSTDPDSAWVSDVSGTRLSHVTVQAVPVTISAQPADTTVAYDYTAAPTLSVTAAATSSGDTVSYQWYKNGTPITDATSASYTIPTGFEVGAYSYYCAVTCDGYTLNSSTATVTVNKIDGSIANNDYTTSYTYTAAAITEPATGNFKTNSGGTVSFTWYKGDSTADADKLTGAPSEAGTYTLKADVAEADHYTAASTTVKVTISYLDNTPVPMLSGTKGTNGWFTGGVTVSAPSGYTIATSNDGGAAWGDSLTVSADMNSAYTYYLKQTSTGYITGAKTVTVKQDTAAPTIGTLAYSEHQSFLDWLFHKSEITVTVPVTDDLSGTDHILYVLTPDGGTAQAAQTATVTNGNATFNVSSTFKGTIAITAYDKAGNASATVTTSKMEVENTAPTLTVTDGTNAFTDNWYTTAQTLHISAADTGSGLKSVTCTVDNGSARTLFAESDSDSGLTSSKDATLSTEEGTHTYVVTATDNALNTTTRTVTVKQDTAAPTIGTLAYSEHQSFLDWLFHKSEITVTVPVTDDLSGADHILYVLTPDGGTAQAAQTATVTNGNATFTVSSTFKGTIAITAYDKAGNASATVTTSKVAVEDTAPTLTVNDGAKAFTSDWYTTAQTLHISAADAGSDLKSVTCTVDNGSARTLFAESDSDSGLTSSKDATLSTEEGTHTYVVTATDNALNTTTRTVTVKQDTVPPTVSASGNPAAPTQSAALHIAATAGASGVKNVTVSGPQGDKDITGTYQNGYSVMRNGTYTFTLTNNAGVSVSSTPVVVTQIDTAKPVAAVNTNGYTDGAWTKNDVKLDISNTTQNLGTTTLEYSTDNGKTWTTFDGSLTDSSEGVTAYSFRATSESGIQSDVKTVIVKIDKTAPTNLTIGFKQNPFKAVAHFVTFGIFFGSTIDVNFTADDLNGVDHYEYQTVAEGDTFDTNGTWQTGSPSIAPDFKGTIYTRAVDKAGNISGTVAKSLVVDQTAPAITANSGDSTLIILDANACIPVEVKDNGAGVGTVTYQINGGEVQTVDLTSNDYSDLTKDYSFNIGSLPDGIYDVTVNAQDNAGNTAATVTVHVTKNAAQTGFGFASASLSKTYGDAPFTVTATGGQSSGAATYTVTSGADVLSVDASTGKVTIQKAGNAVITAMKEAGNGYSVTTAQLTVNVLKAEPTVQVIPTASDITVIGKLSSSHLSGGKTSVPGTFDWTNPDTVVSSSGSYSVTFTPADTENYSTVVCQVPVKVSPVLTGSGSNTPQLDCTSATMPAGVTAVSLESNIQSSGSSADSVVENLIRQNGSLGNLNHLTVYDLKLLDQNGNPIEHFAGKIKVKIPIPVGMSGNLKVLWYNPAVGTLTDMHATREGGYLVFETSHFSYYAVAQLASSSDTGSSTGTTKDTGSSTGTTSGTVPNPKTGSGGWPILPLALLGGSAATSAIIMKRRKISRRKK